MSKAPIRLNSRAWTGLTGDALVGDPMIPPHERAVFEQKPRWREKLTRNLVLWGGALFGGGILCMGLDNAVWSALGRHAFVGSNTSDAPLQVGLAVCSFGIALLGWLGRWRLWPMAMVMAMLSAAATSSFLYVDDLMASAPVTTATFGIVKVELRGGGRWKRDRFRPYVHLIDHRGTITTVYGRKTFIASLVGHDCVTLNIRGEKGHYRFVDAATDLIETPYIDSITGKRNLSRCFTPAAK